MLTRELMELREEFEFLLQQRGPVEFLRELIVAAEGAQVRPYDSQQSSSAGRRSTRFVFCDANGDEAFLTITVEAQSAGGQQLYLDCQPRRDRPAPNRNRTQASARA
jgi:hypothetical protein